MHCEVHRHRRLVLWPCAILQTWNITRSFQWTVLNSNGSSSLAKRDPCGNRARTNLDGDRYRVRRGNTVLSMAQSEYSAVLGPSSSSKLKCQAETIRNSKIRYRRHPKAFVEQFDRHHQKAQQSSDSAYDENEGRALTMKNPSQHVRDVADDPKQKECDEGNSEHPTKVDHSTSRRVE